MVHGTLWAATAAEGSHGVTATWWVPVVASASASAGVSLAVPLPRQIQFTLQLTTVSASREQIIEQIGRQDAHLALEPVVEQQSRRNRWPVHASSPPPLARMQRCVGRLHVWHKVGDICQWTEHKTGLSADLLVLSQLRRSSRQAPSCHYLGTAQTPGFGVGKISSHRRQQPPSMLPLLGRAYLGHARTC
jgi:hypothetical protein